MYGPSKSNDDDEATLLRCHAVEKCGRDALNVDRDYYHRTTDLAAGVRRSSSSSSSAATAVKRVAGFLIHSTKNSSGKFAVITGPRTAVGSDLLKGS